MFATRGRRLGIILGMLLLVAVAVLFVTAQINKPYWQWIAQVEPLADGRTLRAELLFSRPRPDGTFCERVVDTVAEESAAQVAVGVQVYNECAPVMSWGRVRGSAVGHPYSVDVRLRAPLGGRLIVERGSGRPIPIRGESPRYSTGKFS
ncbi:hypothetical protein ACQP2T_35055 [Nonomuraea sp. CA-143628]|uniref:hypothetical protein n=1 Tax=Nonomuraea sp. CA-143628 TaxID=3239997 RepID=UPI003D8B4914